MVKESALLEVGLKSQMSLIPIWRQFPLPLQCILMTATLYPDQYCILQSLKNFASMEAFYFLTE